MEFISLESDPLIIKMKENCGGMSPGGCKFLPGGLIIPKEFSEVRRGIKNMTVRPDDVWVITFPKTGTTVLQEAVWLVKNNLNFEKAREVQLVQRMPFLEMKSLYHDSPLMPGLIKYPTIEDIENLPSPRILKTHLPLSFLPDALWTVKPKIVVTYRNPKEVVYSFHNHSKIFAGNKGSFEDFAEIFLADKYLYSPFWPMTLGLWEKRNESNVLFIQFKDIVMDKTKFIRSLAEFLGVPLTSQEETALSLHLSFDKMKSNPTVNYDGLLKEMGAVTSARFMRSGKVDEWKEKMSKEMIAKFDEWSLKYLKGTDFPYYY